MAQLAIADLAIMLPRTWLSSNETAQACPTYDCLLPIWPEWWMCMSFPWRWNTSMSSHFTNDLKFPSILDLTEDSPFVMIALVWAGTLNCRKQSPEIWQPKLIREDHLDLEFYVEIFLHSWHRRCLFSSVHCSSIGSTTGALQKDHRALLDF